MNKLLLVCILTVGSMIPCKNNSLISYTKTTYKEEMVVIQSNKYEWRYKIENGKTYKRLYNTTLNQWVGDWIRI